MLITEAGLISTPIEAMLYGFSVLMFIMTMRILLHNHRNRRPKYILITAASALLILATAEMVVNIIHICQGFLNVGPTLPGGPIQYFSDSSQPTFVIKSCLYNIQTLILDGIVIHRTYIAWERNLWIVALPILGWFGSLASTIGINHSFALNSGNIFAEESGQWITSNYSLTLATNLSATGLLAYRIWKANRIVQQYKTADRLSPVLRIVIESGAIYSMTIIAALVVFVCKSPGNWVILDMISPIICIVFNMIIVRVGIASDKAFMQSMQLPAHVEPSQRTGIMRPSLPLRRVQSPDDYQIKPISIEITQCKEIHTDDHLLQSNGTDSEPESSRRTKESADIV